MNKIFLTKTIKGNTITIDICFNIIKNGLSDLFYCYNNIEIPKSSEFTLNEVILLLADLNNDVDENTYNDIHSFVLSHIKENEINSSINKTMDEIDELKQKINNADIDIKINIATIFNHINTYLPNKYYIGDNNIYLNKTNVVLPTILLRYFSGSTDINYLNSLHNFWVNCLNKDNYSNIEDLFVFIDNNGLTISPNGCLFLFRRVVNKSNVNNVSLFKFVMEQWKELTLKGKNTNDYYIGFSKNEGMYFISKSKDDETINTIEDLFRELISNSKSNNFTDNHTKTFNYKIGQTYIVDNVDNNPDNTCSYGLHLGSIKYVKGNAWLGETIVGCLVNPRDIIAVADNAEKIRCRKMHICCIINENELDNFDFKLFNYDFEAYKKEDNQEYVDLIFNESNKQAKELEIKLNEYNEQLEILKSKVSLYDKTDINISIITKQMDDNYKIY